MSAEENAALYRRFVDEVINKGNEVVAGELLAPDFVDHTPQPGMSGDVAGYLGGFRMFRQALPDLHVTIDELVVEGDRIAGRGTTRATHTGELAGPMGMIPPTGKPVTFGYINIVRIKDNKAVETWSQVDVMAMLQQIGVLPAPQPAAAS